MPNRALTYGGLAVAGGVGYYLYTAGGDPKVAQKQAQADASKISSDVKSHLPGTENSVKKDAELTASKAGAKFDGAIADAKSRAQQAEADLQRYGKDASAKLEQARRDTGTAVNNAVDKFDKNVSDGASKTKSTVSSWFGGSK